MKLSEIKYKGPKIDSKTKESSYILGDIKNGLNLFTGSFRQCWIRREYVAQHENISSFSIELVA